MIFLSKSSDIVEKNVNSDFLFLNNLSYAW